jgi:beta-lactamase superfamily II metal-dependent hydrolase
MPMLFTLDVRPALKGDCLLLHFGSSNDPGLIIIDGGPKSVYQAHLKPRLEQIRKARKLDKNGPLPVDILMVSHVDDDHIQGIIDLTKEEIAAQLAHKPQRLSVQSFWHNNFDEIIDGKSADVTASVKKQFGEASTKGGNLSDKAREEVKENSKEDRQVVESGLKVLASIEQGFRLRQDAERLGYPRNPEFGGELVIARKGSSPVSIAQGLTFTVLGPLQKEVRELHKKHDKWLEGLKKKGKSPASLLAAYVDKSVPNLASIVVLAELAGKRMLLTGDARGDKILEGLQFAGLLGAGGNSKLEVDVLKVPHHGSANNLDKDFFERIVAKHYVFSGDGKHGNPERESLEMLLGARGEDADFQIHLTYPLQHIDAERKKDWQQEQGKEKARKKKNPKTSVRKNWSPKEHGLKEFFDAHPKLAKKVKIVGKKPHLINLLDPVKF